MSFQARMKKKMRQDLFLDKVKEGQAVRHIDRRSNTLRVVTESAMTRIIAFWKAQRKASKYLIHTSACVIQYLEHTGRTQDCRTAPLATRHRLSEAVGPPESCLSRAFTLFKPRQIKVSQAYGKA